MTVDDIEELIRKYISTGITVVVVLMAPGTNLDDTALPSGAQVVTVQPTRPGPAPAPSSSGEDRTGAGGSDPGADPTAAPGGGGTDGSGDGSPASGSRSGSGSGSASGSGSDSGPGSGSGSGPTSGPGSGSGSGSDDGPGPNSGSGSGSGSDSDSDSDVGSDSSARSGTGTGPTSGPDSGDSPDNAGTGGTGGSDSGSGSGSGRGSGTGSTGSSASASDGTTAAATLGWGTPNREDDFSSGAGQWSIYDGPGHGGQGRRSPSAVSTTGGVLTVTGGSSGTTAGMAWNPGQKYGRWESRVKAPASDPSYNALLLLWPDAEDWPSGGEVDFMEMSDPSRQETTMFLHYGADNQQLNATVQIDATQWHNWAVEWTPDAITAYVDGKEWYRTTDRSTFPPGPMHLCIQLDWFPRGGGAKESTMQVDWVRQYPVGGGDSGRQSGQAAQQSGGSSGGEPTSGNDPTSGVRNILRRMFSWG